MNHQVLTFASHAEPAPLKRTDEVIGIIGLGYVGLPLAVEFAEKFETVIGYDTNPKRIIELDRGIDQTNEVPTARLNMSDLVTSHAAGSLADVTCFIVTVPTPLDQNKSPDLRYIEAACATIARYLKPNDLVIFESTVYPGVTEDICAPLIEELSGLTHLMDFSVAYSPERINPGDTQNNLNSISKLISADTEETLERVADIYDEVIAADLHPCRSIKVAETAKALENTQRDVNIALMNEVSSICEKVGISTKDVIDAAATKWNFVPFTPGLVGGHCIGVDPHYLRSIADQNGVDASVIRNARRVNDEVPKRIFESVLREAALLGRAPKIVQYGLTFKEDVPDQRNSLAWRLAKDIQSIWPDAIIVDPLVSNAAASCCDLTVSSEILHDNVDICVLAVPHRSVLNAVSWQQTLAPKGLLIDVKSAVSPTLLPPHARIWTL